MALEKSDLEALQLLIREENHASEERMNRRFDEVLTTLDALVLTDEKLEQENLLLDQQIKRNDERIDALENKVA